MGWSPRTRLAFGAPLFALLLFGCGPSENGGRHAGHALFGIHHALPLMNRALRLGLRGARGRGGFRRACAADVERLCASALSRREERLCLDEKRDQLSSDCRSALDARARRNEETH